MSGWRGRLARALGHSKGMADHLAGGAEVTPGGRGSARPPRVHARQRHRAQPSHEPCRLVEREPPAPGALQPEQHFGRGRRCRRSTQVIRAAARLAQRPTRYHGIPFRRTSPTVGWACRRRLRSPRDFVLARGRIPTSARLRPGPARRVPPGRDVRVPLVAAPRRAQVVMPHPGTTRPTGPGMASRGPAPREGQGVVAAQHHDGPPAHDAGQRLATTRGRPGHPPRADC